VWLDIEMNPSPGCSWGVSAVEVAASGGNLSRVQEDNCAYNTEWINALQAQGQVVGHYASQSQWESIMGAGCTSGAATQLWYPHYDDSQSFADFSGFGGWTAPVMKQFSDGPSACGVGIVSVPFRTYPRRMY